MVALFEEDGRELFQAVGPVRSENCNLNQLGVISIQPNRDLQRRFV